MGVLVHKDKDHQHPEHICSKILHKMRLVSEIRKLIVIKCWPGCNNSKTASYTKVLLSEYITIGLQVRQCVTRCSQGKMISWLVLDGVIQCISIMVQKVRNSGKILSLFVGIFFCRG